MGNIRVPEKILYFLETHQISRGSRIVVALSGGPDSVALLSGLADIVDDMPLKLFCGHIDHGIRRPAETDREKHFVRKLCTDMGVELSIFTREYGSIEGESRRQKRSIEEVAREVRYGFLQELKIRHRAAYIAVGHTLDDQAETMIMRFFQGSHASGLKGIPPVREQIIRPLMDCSREEIIGYLTSRDIGWCTDSTNEETRYLRNAVRNTIIPAVKQYFPGYRTSLKTLADKMRMLDDYIILKREGNMSWESCKEDGIRIPWDLFQAAPEIIRLYALYNGINTLNISRIKRIPYRFLVSLAAKDLENTTDGQILLRGYGLVCNKKGGYLFLNQDVVLNRKKSYFIVVREKVCYSLGDDINITFFMQESNSSSGQVGILRSKVKWPLIVRSRREGDSLVLTSGRKPLKKVYNEWDVPKLLRRQIPVLEDRSGIIAVLGKPFGYKNLVNDQYALREKKSDEPALVVRMRNGECQ